MRSFSFASSRDVVPLRAHPRDRLDNNRHEREQALACELMPTFLLSQGLPRLFIEEQTNCIKERTPVSSLNSVSPGRSKLTATTSSAESGGRCGS